MNEYEAASLAVQQGALVAQQDATTTAMWVGIGQATVALVVGTVQCALIYAGFRLMRKNNDHRDQQHEETMTALQQQGEALRALIERTAPSPRPPITGI